MADSSKRDAACVRLGRNGCRHQRKHELRSRSEGSRREVWVRGRSRKRHRDRYRHPHGMHFQLPLFRDNFGRRAGDAVGCSRIPRQHQDQWSIGYIHRGDGNFDSDARLELLRIGIGYQRRRGHQSQWIAQVQSQLQRNVRHRCDVRWWRSERAVRSCARDQRQLWRHNKIKCAGNQRSVFRTSRQYTCGHLYFVSARAREKK